MSLVSSIIFNIKKYYIKNTWIKSLETQSLQPHNSQIENIILCYSIVKDAWFQIYWVTGLKYCLLHIVSSLGLNFKMYLVSPWEFSGNSYLHENISI